MTGVHAPCATTLVAALAASVALTNEVAAQADPPEQTASAADARSVGPHSYAQFTVIEFPFPATRFASRTGLGIDQFTLTDLPPDRERTFDGEFGVVDQTFDLGINIVEWLGIEIEARAAALVGLDSAGALFVGANGGAWLRVSGVAQLVRTDTFLLSARLDVSGLGAVSLQPARLVAAFVGDGSVTRVSSIDPTITANFGGIRGSVAAALTANEWLGFMGSFYVEGRRVEIADVDETEGNLAGAIGASFNFSPFDVPLMLLVAARVSWNFADDVRDLALLAIEPPDDVVVEPELGFYYADTEHPNLELGLSTVFGFGDDTRQSRLVFTLAYWW